MSRDSIGNILRVSILLCLVCAVAVSAAAVGLKDRQEANKLLDRQRNVLLATGNYRPEELDPQTVKTEFAKVQQIWVEIATGKTVAAPPGGPDFDPRLAAADAKQQVRIPSDRNIAGIGTRAAYYPVYSVEKEGQLDTLVLPIVGKGLWSTMYGFLALEPDLSTIRGINYYEHAETPGLGGEVDNPRWKQQWQGKVGFREEQPAIEIIKGSVNSADPLAIHRIDGLAGATITSNGVQNMVNYWLGEDGFGKFLDQRRAAANARLTPVASRPEYALR